MSFLKRNAVGVSITDQEIEVVELGKSRGTPVVRNGIRVPLDPDVVQYSRIVDEKTLAEAFSKALKDAEPGAISSRSIVFVLPTSHAHSGFVFVGESAGEDYNDALSSHIKAHVPLAPSDVLFSYAVTNRQNENGEVGVFFIAASQEIVREWRSFFKKQKIDASFVFGPLAAYRSLSVPSGADTVLVVNMSGTATTVSVFGGDVPYYSFGRVFAGEDKSLGGEVQHAIDSVRDTYGLEVDTALLVPPYKDDGHTKEYLEKELGVPITHAAVHVEDGTSFRPNALGAALRALDEKRYGTAPLITLESARRIRAEDVVEEENSEGDARSAVRSTREKKKLKRQKIILGVVVLVGLTAFLGAYWWQASERAKRAEEQATLTTTYTKTQAIEITVPVSVSSEVADTSPAGRVAVYTIQGSGSYREAVANAKRSAEQDLAGGEVLWETPIGEPTDTASVTFPLDVSWFVYKKEATDQLVTAEIEKLNVNSTPYVLNSVDATRVDVTDNTYALTVTANLSLNELLPTATSDDSEAETNDEETTGDTSETAQIGVVLDTPTGWLNVRTSPSTASDQVSRLSSGDSFTIIDTSEDWYQVELSDGNTGWVFSEFVAIE